MITMRPAGLNDRGGPQTSASTGANGSAPTAKGTEGGRVTVRRTTGRCGRPSTLGAMGTPRSDPVIAFESAAAWEAWLEDEHATAGGVWIKMAKKAPGIPSVTHAEALEVALSYGWIDGQRDKLDDQWFLQRFTPRRARSNWSKINRAAAERLIEEGRMQPAGHREVERAQADGRWDSADVYG